MQTIPAHTTDLQSIAHSWWAIAASVAIALSMLGCGEPPDRPRILVLALDGMDPPTVDLLIAEGKLPNFARIQREGASAPLMSESPLLSPIVWTTVATGKRPSSHGIGHFVAFSEAAGRRIPVTSEMRRVPALWNIFSHHDREVAVVGWWATWPSETVKGSIVSDHFCYHFQFPESFGGVDMPAKTYPPDLEDDLARYLRRPQDLTREEVAAFIDIPDAEFEKPPDFHDNVFHFKWALSAAKTHRAIGLALWNEREPDLELVYIEGTDTIGHLFGHLFRAEGLEGELLEQQRKYGLAVERIYEFADATIGRYLEALDPRTTLVVLSDHGFQLGRLIEDPSRTRELRGKRGNYHRPEGILYMYGNQVRAGARFESPTIVDVAPTLLALAGIPPGEDMPGRVLVEGLEIEDPPRVPTYDDIHRASPAGPVETMEVNEQILERLRSLGYLDTVAPVSDRVLASQEFGEGRYAEAEALYRELLLTSPDDAELRASLAGALGAQQRYDEARAELEIAIRLDPLDSMAYFNLGTLHEHQGDPQAAAEQYRNALRYDPDHQPARRAYVRLTGREPEPIPEDRRQARALELAAEASTLARRGAYDQALARLDEAEALAPELVTVHQYRANIAYLAGDREAAVAALEKALALEPDNALFRENLRALRGPATD